MVAQNLAVRQPHYLTLDHLIVNFQLAKILPASLAFKFHALPIAQDGNKVTVAMANPGDGLAFKAVADALDMEVHPVQVDEHAIDNLLAEVWSVQPPLRMLVYHQDSPIADRVQAYAAYFGELLHGNVDTFSLPNQQSPSLAQLAEAAGCGHDLVIFGEPNQSLLRRLLSGPSGCQAAERIPTSVLIARQPRWPIKKVLFVTRGMAGVDDIAIDWLVRVVRASNAAVTILGVVMPMPVFFQHAITQLPEGAAGWLTTDTPLGHQLQRIDEKLSSRNIQSRLRFRDGTPEQQILREVAHDAYDLLVLADDPHNWWERRLVGSLIDPLLRKIHRPVLVVKPAV